MAQPVIQSRLITELPPLPGDWEQRLREATGVPDHQKLLFQIMRTEVDGFPYWCAWAGGRIVDGQPHLTDIGTGAALALAELPYGVKALVFQELHMGEIPLQEKVCRMLQALPENSKVCFVGDLSGALNGHMGLAFNLTGAPYPQPGEV